nr:integrase, catalytic region, zinc finger, CCHC-type, peptidase aspartic, catalytic [Tanacetum cinerariifolium]
HDAIESASENFIENHIDSQKDYDESDVDHNDSKEKDHLVDKLIRKFNKKIVRCQKRIKKANQQSKDFENQNKDLQDKYDVSKNQATTFEINNKELNEQLKELIEKNNDLLALTKLLKEQLQVKHVVIDTNAECQEKYAKLEAKRYEYMIGYSTYFDNDKQHRKHIADQVVLKVNLETIESLKSKSFESSEKVSSKSENQSENDCLVVEKKYDKEENPKVIAPGMFKLNVSRCISPISMSKSSCESNNVEIKLKRKRHTSRSVRRPKNSGVIWKKKGSSNTSNVSLSAVSVLNLNKNVKRYSRKDLLACNNLNLGETRSDFVCNNAMNVSCDSRMNDLLDDNNFFIFDDESVKISLVSKMHFRKKPRDSMNVFSKSNLNKSLPRTMHKWLPKLQPLAEPVAKWFPRVKRQIDKISKTPNSPGPIYKWHMTGNRALLTNFVKKFLKTVSFGNNDFAVIAGYGDVVSGSMTIKKVFYVEGLGHNLFSVGQFYDKGLEFAFRKSTCFVRNKDGVDLLTDDRLSNLYTIALNEVASNSSTCLLAKASSSQSWLWHQREVAIEGPNEDETELARVASKLWPVDSYKPEKSPLPIIFLLDDTCVDVESGSSDF